MIRLYAIRYGISSISTTDLFAKPDTVEQRPFHWLMYLITTPDKKILVDTGFHDPRYAKIFNVVLCDPVTVLKDIGYAPEDITDIILTHHHFDHIGGVTLYPEAVIHITEKSYDAFINMKQMASVRAFLQDNPHLSITNGSYSVGDFIDVEEIDGHAPGSCVVYLDMNGERVLLTGDEVYVDEHILQKKQSRAIIDPVANRRFVEKTVASKIRFFTFHSPNIVTEDTPWREIQNIRVKQ